MPTLQELEALADATAAPAQARPDAGPFQGIADFLSALGSGAFDAGKGTFFGLLDVLDRPGRAARHALTGDFRQALEAFDPGNLLTPGTESRPISGGEVLERWGIEEGPSVPLLGSTRAIGGFGLAILADPFTYFGAPIGAFAGRAGSAVGRTAQRGIAGVAAREIPVLSGLARGTQAAGRSLGRGFIKDFDLGLSEAQGIVTPEALTAFRTTRDRLRAEAPAVYEQLTQRGRNLDALVAREAQKDLVRFTEIPGAVEDFMVAQGADPAKIRRLVTPERASELRRALGTSDEAVAATIAGFRPQQAAFLTEYLAGERSALLRLPGKRGTAGAFEDITGAPAGMQEEFIGWDHLQVEAAQEMVERTGVAHTGHFSTTHGPRDIERVLAQELTTAVPSLKGLEGEALVEAARKAVGANPAAQAKARAIVGTIEQINATATARGLKPIFRESLTEIAVGEGLRYHAVKTAKEMFDTVLDTPGLSKTFPAAPAAESLPAGWRMVDTSDLADVVRNRLQKAGTPFLAMPRAIADDLMGPRGLLSRVQRVVDDPNPILDALRRFNNVYKPWTLNLPSTAVRNVIGDFALNAVAGVAPTWVTDAWPVFQRMKALVRGENVSPTMVVRGKTVDVAAMARAGVPGESFWHSQVAQVGADLLDQTVPARTAISWDALRKGVPLVAHGSEWLNKTGTSVARIAHYLERTVARGLDPVAAAQSVKKYLYDFDNLTPFEQTKMAQFLPFYSWARQNIPNQLRPSTLLGGFGFGAPGKPGVRFVPTPTMARLKVTLDEEGRADVPEAALPTWLQGQLTLPVGRKDGKLSLFALNGWLPVADLSEIDNSKKLVKYVFNLLTPLATEPVEQLVNWDAYFERAIQAYPGEQEQFLGHAVGRRTAKLARNARILNEIDRTILPLLGIKTGAERLKDGLGQPEWKALLARAFTGAKVRDVDLQQAKQRGLARVKRELATLEMQRRFAIRDKEFGNVETLDALRKEKQALRDTLAAMNPADVPSLWLLTEPAFARALAG